MAMMISARKQEILELVLQQPKIGITDIMKQLPVTLRMPSLSKCYKIEKYRQSGSLLAFLYELSVFMATSCKFKVTF
jgi:hypothetical protein